jgi:hypothetical protein
MSQLPPTLPEAPLLALAGRWDLSKGEHPHHAAALQEILATLPLFPSREEYAELATLGLPIQLAERGHHSLYETGPLHASTPARLDEFPLAPVFVRDLCGRVIHTGLNPLPNPPSLPLFPRGCADVPASMGGANYLENAIFTHWNLLDIAPAAEVRLAGTEAVALRRAYPSPGSTPYKIRPNTFYADGWRLPQVARVFARPSANATALGEAFMQRWATRPEGQDYEVFYETVNGANWFEELFLQGVTVIPTLEGYNGANQVAPDFTLQGVEAGRAVAGLHTVVGQEASPLPQGTILAVKAPGFATATQVIPAQVVVSTGPSLIPTDALLPNLSLPHPHVAPNWGGCWLPTQPAHFVAPALWDWLPSGHFVQTEGPLWAPQHYVYASTNQLIRATRKPLTGCETLLELPEKLKRGFNPVVALTSYDTLHERTRQERAHSPQHPLHGTALDTLPLGQPIAPVGYHPLPKGWPTATQAALFPETRPQSSLPPCPSHLAARLAPVATPTKAPHELAKHHQALSEPFRAVLAACNHEPPSSNPLTDWLPDLPNSQLQLNVKRLFASRHYRAALTLQHGQLPAALFRFKETSLAWRRLRYRLTIKYTAALHEAETKGLSLPVAEGLAGVMPESAHIEARTGRLLGLTRVPASSAPALHRAPLPVKVAKRKTARNAHGTR